MFEDIEAPNKKVNEDDNIDDITESERFDGTNQNHEQVQEYENIVVSSIPEKESESSFAKKIIILIKFIV